MVASAVDEMPATIDALATVDLDGLSDGDLDAELVSLLHERHRLDAEIARRAARWDARSVWIGDGSRSPAARLSRDGQIALSTARDVVRRARALTAMPRAAAAWAAGDISADQIDLLAHARAGDRAELFARDESMLVAQASTLRPAQFAKAVRYWRGRADAEVGADGTPPDAVERLSFAETLDGTIVGDFSLDAVRGAAVVEALRRIERELHDADRRDGAERTKAQRLGAALYEMAVRAHTAPKDGKRPEPLVVILAGESTVEDVCELSTGTVIAKDLIVAPVPGDDADDHLRERRPRRRRIEAAHVPGSAAPGHPGTRPTLPTPIRLRRADFGLRCQSPHRLAREPSHPRR